MSKPANPVTRLERAISFAVLLALCALAFWLYRVQSRFSRAITEIADAAPAQPVAPEPKTNELRLAEFAPEGFAAAAPSEFFTPDTAYEKINGKVELYLPAGFVALHCRRFAAASDEDSWFELFVYEMSNPRGAFAVYSAQRREDSRPHELTGFAYSTENALFFAHGRYYVEVVGSDASPELQTAIETAARRFVAATQESAGQIEELTLFPPEHLVPDSLIRFAADGFGFEPFDDLFAATHLNGERETQMFVTIRKSPGDAARLAAAYRDFLIDNGGVFEELSTDIPGASLYNLFGTYELVFSTGKIVAGVHQAESAEAAEFAGAMLQRHIRKVKP